MLIQTNNYLHNLFRSSQIKVPTNKAKERIINPGSTPLMGIGLKGEHALGPYPTLQISMESVQ